MLRYRSAWHTLGVRFFGALHLRMTSKCHSERMWGIPGYLFEILHSAYAAFRMTSHREGCIAWLCHSEAMARNLHVIPNPPQAVWGISCFCSLGRRFFTPRCSVQNDMSFRARPVGRRGISFLSDYHSERMWEIFVFRGAVIPNEHEESQSIVLSNAVGSSYIEFSWQEILYFMLFCSERQNEKEKAFGNSISWNDSTFCEA